jgi:hypothetical protein
METQTIKEQLEQGIKVIDIYTLKDIKIEDLE